MDGRVGKIKLGSVGELGTPAIEEMHLALEGKVKTRRESGSKLPEPGETGDRKQSGSSKTNGIEWIMMGRLKRGFLKGGERKNHR